MTASAVDLAVAQLAELEALSGGALTVVDLPGDGAEIVISMETGVTARGAGIRVRERERFRIQVSATFPYEPPSVFAEHRRWKDSPHVNWGNLLCLYAAPAIEWIPADGMRGLVERLLIWLGRAAEGTLDPDDQPLHPPVAVPSATGCLVVEPSLGHRVPWAGAATGGASRQFAWCVRDGGRVVVVAWCSEQQLVERVNRTGSASTNGQGLPYFVALAVLLPGELWWEYPSGADQLAEGLAEAGYSRERLLADLAFVGQANHVLRGRRATPDADPVIVMIGTPSRRIAGTTRLAHLVAWKLDDYGEEIVTCLAQDRFGTYNEKLSQRLQGYAREWLRAGVVRWMSVYDQRPETTRRRDQDTAISWLSGRRVLVLGCGALGAPVAEYCVRAGASAVTAVDRSVVTPGILVRQPYRDGDIGMAKAVVLAERLNLITRKPRVRGVVANAVTYVLSELDAGDFDLIVDATANSGVRAAIEQAHRNHIADGFSLPHTAMMIIGHRSDLGLVTVSRSGATGTGHDVLRRVQLAARRAGTRGWREVLEDFFPDPPRTDTFLPEPGCSAPTFVGSAADVTALAASMLTEVAGILAESDEAEATMTAVAVRGPASRLPQGIVLQRLGWPNDVVVTDPGTSYDVRLSTQAMAEIRAEVRRGARVRGPRIETGGMLIGSVDDATGVVSVDIATGPSPDSKLSSGYFFHGMAGTDELVERYSHQSGRVIGFLGIWHSHPGGPARPSKMDMTGMSVLTTVSADIPRALMVIVGGAPETWLGWVKGSGLPDIHVEMVARDPATLDETPAGPALQEVPFGEYLSGGYSVPPTTHSRRRRRWVWWRRR